MEESLYDEAIKLFRNGVPVLTKDNFSEYVSKNNVATYSVENLNFFSHWGIQELTYAIFIITLSVFYQLLQNLFQVSGINCE